MLFLAGTEPPPFTVCRKSIIVYLSTAIINQLYLTYGSSHIELLIAHAIQKSFFPQKTITPTLFSFSLFPNTLPTLPFILENPPLGPCSLNSRSRIHIIILPPPSTTNTFDRPPNTRHMELGCRNRDYGYYKSNPLTPFFLYF